MLGHLKILQDPYEINVTMYNASSPSKYISSTVYDPAILVRFKRNDTHKESAGLQTIFEGLKEFNDVGMVHDLQMWDKK